MSQVRAVTDIGITEVGVGDDRDDLPIFIHSELDDVLMSCEAFRVYAHIARRVGNKKGGKCWSSYQSIGDACFSVDYPKSKTTRRKHAIAAIKELLDLGLASVEKRRTEKIENLTNIYRLTPKRKWKVEPGGGSPTELGGSPTELGGGSPTELGGSPTELGGGSPTELGGSPTEPKGTTYESSSLSKGSSKEEREREARKREEEQQAAKNPEPEQAIAPPTQEAPTGLPVKPETPGEDQCSAATPSAVFDAETYDWSQYQDAGDGGSNPQFFGYLVKRTQAYSDRRVAQGGEAIDRPIEYAIARIKKKGLQYYREFEIAEGLRSPDKKAPARASPKEFAWTDWQPEDDTPANLSADLSMAQYCWKELKLGWEDPSWLAWLQKAQERSPFEWQDKRSGFAHLPDWALRHLAHDMQIPFGGG